MSQRRSHMRALTERDERDEREARGASYRGAMLGG